MLIVAGKISTEPAKPVKKWPAKWAKTQPELPLVSYDRPAFSCPHCGQKIRCDQHVLKLIACDRDGKRLTPSEIFLYSGSLRWRCGKCSGLVTPARDQKPIGDSE